MPPNPKDMKFYRTFNSLPTYAEIEASEPKELDRIIVVDKQHIPQPEPPPFVIKATQYIEYVAPKDGQSCRRERRAEERKQSKKQKK